MTQKYILGMSQDELEILSEDLGLPSYRGKQLYRWLYAKECDSFSEMTDLSKEIRQEFENNFSLRQLTLVDKEDSPNTETIKFLWQLHDGKRVESVWIPDGERTTICISSQVGCALKCEFCQTGRMGFMRNLSSGEIVEQILQIRKIMKMPNTNVVFMGMGEPFLNYDNVVKAAQILTDKEGISIANRKVTISTAGIVPRIRQFTKEGHKMRLAISLNHSNDEERNTLMPINKKYSTSELLSAAKEWAVSRKDRITFEYVLIKGVNDSEKNARELIALTKNIPNKINVIPLNSNDKAMQPPDKAHVENFMFWLSKSPWMITLRRPKGRDIEAACGMLFAKNKEKLLKEQYHFNATNQEAE